MSDRVAQLEAELVEARLDRDAQQSRAQHAERALERERAEHERTKAELKAWSERCTMATKERAGRARRERKKR